MADVIKLLPDHVANQIAAGEVVQRPSSVVKELLENSIDASSSQITLIIKDGGKTLIQVVDDGQGMSDTDARLSFERHATSKITSADDLFNLRTKGFRGEALASIAAIAHVDLMTKRMGEDLGTYIKIAGSAIVSQEVRATAKGTSIAVKNLFFNIPARRNFLKSDLVELRHIIDEFQRVALAHPQVTFKMFNNGSEHFNLPKGSFRQRIVHILGKKVNERLVPVDEATEVVKISGFICKPEFAKKSRGEQFFFVNDRYIKSPYLNHGVVAAFEGLLRPDTYPGYFIRLEVDPKSMDINIHPTKTEVKFDDEHTLYATLRAAIKHGLGQFHVAPVLDFQRDGQLDTPYRFKDRTAKMPAITVDADFNPFKGESSKSAHQTSAPNAQGPKVKGWQDLYDTAMNNDAFSQLHVESDLSNIALFESSNQAPAQGKVLFQLHRKFVVSTIKSGLLVIDQYRAHQRILYERFLKEITVKDGVTQRLLFPVHLEYTKTELDVFKSLRPDLQKLGFEVSFDTTGNLTVTGLPVNMPESVTKEVLNAILASSLNHDGEGILTRAEWLSQSLSSSLAIKNGTPLEQEELSVLVDDLFACKEPKLSPFNKIVYTTIGVDEIESKF